MSITWDEQERQCALAELRMVRLETALFLAHLDYVGMLLKDRMITPWAARAALADLYGRPAEEDSA